MPGWKFDRTDSGSLRGRKGGHTVTGEDRCVIRQISEIDAGGGLTGEPSGAHLPVSPLWSGLGMSRKRARGGAG